MPKLEPAPVRLDRLEWDFSECPDSEIYDCWLYEFAREVDWVRDFAVSQKEKALQYAVLYSFLIFPDWPEKPYLSVSEDERLRLRRTVRPDEKEIEADFFDMTKLGFYILQQFIKNAREQSGRPVVRSKTGRIQVSLFEIDWMFPDSMLLRFFESYLTKNRPAHIHPIEHRAKAVPDAKRKRQLRELGMFRLVRANALNISRARKTGFLKSKKADPWYSAVKNIELLLESADSEIVPRLKIFLF